jgi:hypothetical protein
VKHDYSRRQKEIKDSSVFAEHVLLRFTLKRACPVTMDLLTRNKNRRKRHRHGMVVYLRLMHCIALKLYLVLIL